MADFPIPEGHYLLGGLSKENARQALAEAEENGFGPEAVLTRRDGFIIPLAEGAKAPAASTPDDSWKNADIQAWAEEHGVDLSDATTKKDMLAAIQAAGETKEES